MKKILDARKEKLIKDVGCKQGSASKLEKALKKGYIVPNLVNDKYFVKNNPHKNKLYRRRRKSLN
eukprot:TRINITY_DN309_c1_g3_i2.p1 TRINITY_DN309_c1_g3~~TRINITY_DN309_c1_g3_i2.p1  ORF type:complete len:65 (+),score=10.17 TRINITY_DN309_c1_g3_i2:162-356(+)